MDADEAEDGKAEARAGAEGGSDVASASHAQDGDG